MPHYEGITAQATRIQASLQSRASACHDYAVSVVDEVDDVDDDAALGSVDDDSALPPAFALVVGFLQVIPLKTAMRPEEDS